MKRITILFAALLIIVASSCSTHRTCPTYMKNDVKNTERA